MKLKKIVHKRIFKPYSARFERRRSNLILNHIELDSKKKILDLGGGDGRRMAHLFPGRTEGIYIADIRQQDLEIAGDKYGFETILLDESGKLDYPDNYFDFIFCNSVIEHVTVDKKDIYNILSNHEFRVQSLKRQEVMAREIRRVGRSYFVQTPNKNFLIESHLWFPFPYLYLPRLKQIRLIRLLNRFWVKRTSPDFSLLTFRDMKMLFPESDIIREKSLCFTKSLIALKS